MQVTGQLQVPYALPPAHTDYESGRASESVRAFWRTEKSLAPAGNRTMIPEFSNIYPLNILAELSWVRLTASMHV